MPMPAPGVFLLAAALAAPPPRVGPVAADAPAPASTTGREPVGRYLGPSTPEAAADLRASTAEAPAAGDAHRRAPVTPAEVPVGERGPAVHGGADEAAVRAAAPPLRPVGAAAPAPLLDEAQQARLEADHHWPAGTIQAQLDRDGTQVPFGAGALFVPAMTQGLDEPPVTVWRDDRQVAEAVSGVRVVLPPGRYQVRMGSGNVAQRFAHSVVIHEQATTVLPVDWAGMTVHVVDPQLNSLRQAYEIIRMSDRAFVGLGFGVDEQAGEPVATWILPPGLYKLVRAGGTYRDRTDFATVRLLPGQHIHFLVVADRDTGDFKGVGEARPEELFRPGRGLRAAFLLGGEASLIARQGVAGYSSGHTYDLQGFLDTKLNVEIAGSPLLLRLQMTEGQQRVPDLDAWVKTRDTLQLDLLYIYGLKPWVGPYVRTRAVTNAFASTSVFLPSRTVTVLDAGRATVTDEVGRLQLSPAFGTIDTTYGAGLNLRILKTLIAETTVRAGLGLQQVRYSHVLQDVTPSGASDATFDRLSSYSTFGIEGMLIAIIRLTRFVVVNIVLDGLVPFDRHQKTTLDLDGTLALKLTQYASVNYRVRFNQRPSYLRPAVEQDLRLRFSVELL